MSDDFNFDYSKSPLANPEFLRQATAQDQIASALENSQVRDAIVTADREGNELAADGTFANDIMTLSHGELEARYGRSVADQRIKLQDTIRQQRQAQTADRTNAQVVGDSALGVGAGFVGLVGSLSSATLQGAGAVDEYFDENNTGLGEFGLQMAETTNEATSFIRSFQSQELQERKRLSAIEGELDALDSAAQEARDIENGANPFMAATRRVGRDILNTGERILDDGAVAGDLISEALGSLGPSAKLAQGGAALLRNAGPKGAAIGAGLGVGVSEASGVLAEASQAVMNLSHEQLSSGSDSYNAYLEQGLSPEQAKMRVAVETGREAFVRQMPSAVALGLIASRFETNPVGSFKGSNFLSTMRQIGTQALEEAGQGSIGKFNENVAVQNNADDSRDLTEGVGESLASGAIAGAGMAGVLATPSTARQSVSDAASLISQAAGSDTGQKVIETARAASETVVDSVRDTAEGVNRSVQNTGIKAARETQDLVTQLVERDNLQQAARAVLTEPDTSPLPENQEQGGSVLSNVSNAIEQFSKRSFKPTDAQTVFAADQVSKLRGSLDTMPESVRTSVEKMLNSPQVRRIQDLAMKVDLNKTQSSDTAITNDVIAESVSVARVNPTNVNPEVVNKILKESGESLSQEDLRILEGASRIATVVNDHVGRQVEISRERNIGLTRLGQNPKQELTQETASRSIRAEGYTDRNGKDLRSINDFAADIFEGAQSPDGKIINKDGQRVSVQNVMGQFTNFVQHMNNKVDALNRSYAANNENGRGPLVSFRGLVGGTRFVEADQYKNPVAFHKGNPNSLLFAQQVENDLAAAVEVYNEIRNTFPELFGSLPEAVKTDLVKEEEQSTIIEETEAQAEVDEQNQEQEETQEKQEVDAKDTIVTNDPDEVGASSGNNQTIGNDIDSLRSVLEAGTRKIQFEGNVDVTQEMLDLMSSFGFDVSNPSFGVFEKTEEVAAEEAVEENVETDNGLPEGLDRGRPGEAQTFQLYHGTGARFSKFDLGKAGQNLKDKSGFFFTNSRQTAENYAKFSRFGGAKDPNVMEVTVEVKNPLEILSGDTAPDQHWINNKDAYYDLTVKGGHDSAVIRANDGEIMVVKLTDEGLTILNPEVNLDEGLQDDVEDTGRFDHLHESFNNTYTESDSGVVVEGIRDLLVKERDLENRINPETLKVVRRIAKPLIQEMNKRLGKKAKFGGQNLTVQEHVQQNTEENGVTFSQLKQYRNTAIVDRTTGEYDNKMLEQATIALVDWMMTATARDPNQINEALEELGLSYNMVNDEQLNAIAFGLSPAMVKSQIARDVLHMWGVKENIDAPMSQLEGIVQGVVSEMLTVLAQFTDKKTQKSLISIEKIPTMVDGNLVESDTLVVSGLADIQKEAKKVLQGDMVMTAREAFFNDARETYSIGTPIKGVATTQSHSGVKLSSLEKAALKKMQDTPHYRDEGRYALFNDLGFESLLQLFGYQDESEILNQTVKNSVAGKNLSIVRNLEDADILVEQLGDNQTPVYYPVSVSKVGRHQYQGVNPQSNKVLRALVTPTWSDMTFSKEDMDAFWLTVAQAADLYKVEKGDHAKILSEVKDTFDGKYRNAVEILKEWMRTGEIDKDAFVSEMGVVEPQQVAAVHAVAEMEYAKENGQEIFRTSLSFELDGLTNGAANMMVNYGQGEITEKDFQNFNRIGLFLGQVGKTVNDYFKVGNKDLYETTSRTSQSNLFSGLKKMKPKEREMMLAAGRFAARFGNFEVTEDGSFEMTRNTAKNPMTKVNYGSGVQGVGVGIADDMLVDFYKKIQGIPANTNLEEYFGYPGIQNDIKTLFGDTLPSDLGQGSFEFPSPSQAEKVRARKAGKPEPFDAVSYFRRNISNTIGNVLTESTKSVIGDKITEVNDMLVFTTNVQSQYLQLVFQDKLEQLAEKRAQEGKIRRSKKTNKPIITELTRRDYMSVVRELESMSPVFVSDDQTLAIGGFQPSKSNFELSSSMDGNFRQPAHLPVPDDVGVRSIPYSVIGTGDAMMMNFIFGSEGAPNDVLGIFDGLDVPANKVKEYAPYVNQQVLKTWERDVLAMAVQNFSGFLSQVGSDPMLDKAFAMVKEKSKKSSVVVSNPEELRVQLEKRHKENLARKKVLKRIPLSVDQMGGSDVGFSRGEGTMDLGAINYEIHKELNGISSKEEDVNIEVQESTVEAVAKSLRLNETQKKVMNAIVPSLPNVKVVIGTLSQLNAYRQENFPDDGLFLEGNAQFDYANGIIFSTTTRPETILHEMVHAATYSRVLAHYNGETHDAVLRLEKLMEEFMALDLNDPDYREAKGSILENSFGNNAASKAAALNEFMAYALTNQKLSNTLKRTETKTIAGLAKRVIDVMRRLMGGVPTNMFDQTLFNTRVLNQPPIDNGGNGDDGGDNSNGENTPPAENYTNFWIDLIKGYIDDVRADTSSDKFRKNNKLNEMTKNANRVIDNYRQVGMLADNKARRTFKAIYMVMAAEMEMDSNTVIALTKVFNHIESNMTPEMFGSDKEAPQVYSAVINSFGAYKNGNISDAVSVLLALSQTSKRFRNVLDQIPEPEGNAQVNGSLSSFLTQATAGLMRKVMGTIQTDDRNVLDTMDKLAESLIQMDKEREFETMRHVTGSFDKMDQFTSNKLSQLSDFMKNKNEEIKESTRRGFTKTLFNTVTLGTNLLDKYNSEQTASYAKEVTHMNVPILSLVPIREFVSEIIGTDRTKASTVALLDEVNSQVSGMRQAYREDLPVILQDLFETHPNAEQWTSMFNVLGKSDFTKFVDPTRLQQSMDLLENSSKRRKRISELEQALDANYLPYIAQDAKDKAQQLADYMNGKGAGLLLMRNAYAIAKNLDGDFNESMVEVIDELTTLYNLDQMDSAVREETVQLWQNEPRAITGLITYIQGLNEVEDNKPGITEQAKMNGYKGYIPNHGDKETRIVIEAQWHEEALLQRGYTKLGPYKGDVDSLSGNYYYVTTTRQSGAYSQGVMQNVQSTYRGVDINTGLTITGETSGFISGDNVAEEILNKLQSQYYKLDDNKETLLPVFDKSGLVSGFERAINPDLYKSHMRQDENLAVMLGAWAGRHVEEMFAEQYNRQLVDQLADIWNNREIGKEDMFIDLSKSKDPIYAESFRLIPQSIKDYMNTKFGADGIMVRKDMANLSVGYREASLADMWSGKTRLPSQVQKAITMTANLLLGNKAMKYITGGKSAFELAVKGEQFGQGIVSSAKDIIVIRSLVVPLANTQSNVVQLSSRGVPSKQIIKGFRSKLAEVEEYNKNRSKVIELEARIRLAANNANQKRILESQIQVIEDLNKRMSIAPLIEAGAYKNLSEGLTDLDVELSKGRIGDIIEGLANKLPKSVSNIAKVGLVSKSTKIYQVANRATQYGDFLAKSIYYDHLIEQGFSHEDAITKMNEEFVNFSDLPGRTRSYLESIGLMWFMAFKIRSTKIALQILRENPVRALAINNALPDVGSPIQDNILSVTAEGRLDYATGYEMLFSAPELNPWVNLMSE